MPVAVGPVFDRCSEIDVLIGSLAGVGNAVEGEGPGGSGGRIAIAGGYPKLGCRAEGVAQVHDPRVVVKLIDLEGVVALEGFKAAVVIELLVGAPQLQPVAKGSEGSGIPLIKQRGKGGAAARGPHIHGSGGSIGTVEHAVGPAIDLEVSDSSGGQVAVIEGAPDIANGNSILVHLIGIGIAATNEQRSQTAVFALTHDKISRHLAQRIDQVGAIGKGSAALRR